jgi:hypothetical protein
MASTALFRSPPVKIEMIDAVVRKVCQMLASKSLRGCCQYLRRSRLILRGGVSIVGFAMRSRMSALGRSSLIAEMQKVAKHFTVNITDDEFGARSLD